MMRARWWGAAVVSLVGLAACGGSDNNVDVQFSSKTEEVAEANAGDVKITSTDGALVLAVISDSVVIQLSDSLRQSVADSVKRETKDAGGVGAIISNAVTAAVSTAMGFKVRVPARNVENLRYENGELHFDVKGGMVNLNTSNEKNSSNANGGRFAEADARRFIDAVKAAQARQPEM